MSTNSIIPASTAIQTFRDSGYKSTASALAELIDNSIEAEALNIQVLTLEKESMGRHRMATKISEIMIYDDGIGMDKETLGICLQFGNGTRLASRKGIGRFGIGLPNASVSQCTRVEIYSWRDGDCHWTYLDIDEIRNTGQQNVNSVEKVNMPNHLLTEIEGTIKDSGSLIVWKNCDRIDISRAKTLFKRMESELCRVYRHFLDVDNNYGTQRSVKLINCGGTRAIIELKPNDPLYIMKPSTTPGYQDEPSNTLFGKVIEFKVPYDEEGNEAWVEIRFSISLPEVQAIGGNSDLGGHYGHNTGISFVRAAREIDFGTFGYFNDKDVRQRWWGCEIRFEPTLDEVFGVTNNKQSVRGIHFLELKDFKKDHPDEWEEMIEESPKLLLRKELSKHITNNLKTINEIIISRGKGARSNDSGDKPEQDKPSKIVNSELASNTKKTKSQLEGEKKTKEQKLDEWTVSLLNSDSSLSPEVASQVAEEKIDLKVEKSFSSWPGSQFFTVVSTGSTCNLIVNRQHPFFSQMYEPLVEQADHKYIDALDLMLMAYARMQDELYDRVDDIEEINNNWGTHLKKFLKKLETDA
mgnify:CR=1 FL=1